MNKQEFLSAKKDREIIVGFKQSLKAVKGKKAEVVVVSKNCPKDFIDALGQVEVFDGTSKDLAVVCGRPYNISVLAVVK